MNFPNFEGFCPDCQEHTTAGESCCNSGAIVDGDLVTDEQAIQEQGAPGRPELLVTGAPFRVAFRLYKALRAASIVATISGGENMADTYTVRIFR